MDIQRAFTVLFEDKGWLKKILFGGLFTFLSMFLVGIPFLVGYLLRMVKNGRTGDFIPLPEWDDMGELFKEGLMLSVVLIVYGLIAGFVSMILSMIPCLGCILSPLVYLALALVIPYIVLKYADTQQFGDCFNFSEMYEYTARNISNLVIYVLIIVAMSIISSIVGSILLFIGIFFTNFWVMVGNAYLILEVEKHDKAKQAAQ